jgi:hypothetical protein
MMAAAVELLRPFPNQELIWASPRELLNIFQADQIGCHVITVTNDVLKKLSLVGKDLDGYSLETVKMFHDDATAAGFSLDREPATVGVGPVSPEPGLRVGLPNSTAVELSIFAAAHKAPAAGLK